MTAAGENAAVPLEMAERLHQVWQAGTGQRLPDWAPRALREDADEVLAMMPRVTAVTRWRKGEPDPIPGEPYPHAGNVHHLAWQLLTFARDMHPLLDVPERLAWVAVAAGAPGLSPIGPVTVALAEVQAWSEAGLPRNVAPSAFAAGLSINEAEARHAAGTLTEDGLRMLAALRGWAFPPVS